MKKLFTILAFIAVASFTSCTELDDDNETLIEQSQAVDKDRVDPRNGSGS
jgi:hypothetical protein